MNTFFTRTLKIVCALAFVWMVSPAQNARANEVNFACGSYSGCGSATLNQSGPNYNVGSGITMTTQEAIGTIANGTAFTLTFDTVPGTATITDGTDTLTGSILAFGPPSTLGSNTDELTLHILWTIPSGPFGTYLGSPNGTDITTVNFNFNSSNQIVAANVNVDPTPEPATLALLGSGLALIGGFIRRKDTNRLVA